MKNKTRASRSRTVENIADVAESVEENPGLFIPRRSLELGIPQTSLHRILHKDLGLKAHKVQCHTSNETIDLSREKFPDRVISREVITIGLRDLEV